MSIVGTGSVCIHLSQTSLSAAARGSCLCPCPREHLGGNKRQFKVVFLSVISVFNKLQLCIFFIYQANFFTKRILLPGLFLCFIALPVSTFLSSLPAWIWPQALDPHEQFAFLNHCLSGTYLTWSPKPPRCSEVSQLSHLAQPGSSQGHSGLRNRHVTPSVTP